MKTPEIIMTVLSTSVVTGGIVGFIVKTVLETGIRESIGSVYKKQLEDHKFRLKNSETVFKYKLNASKSLYKILHDILPKNPYPGMEWDDACEEIASSFSKHQVALNEFLCEYQSTLSFEILKRVRKATVACADGNYEFYWDQQIQNEVCTDSAKEKANELYEALQVAVEMLREEVHEMISVPKA